MSMHMRQNQGMRQKQGQQLRMMAHMIQTTEMMQLPLLEFRTYIENALTENPLLTTEDASPADSDFADSERTRDLDESALDVGSPDGKDDFERLDNMSDQISDFQDDEYRVSASAREEAADKHADMMANIAAPAESLQDHLNQQLQELELPQDTLLLAEEIVGNLDTHGFLMHPVADIFGPSYATQQEEILDALKIVQSLEPRGVGARDLVDCLLLQLDADAPDFPIIRRILTDFMSDLQKNRLPQIAKALDITMERLNALIARITRLNPDPGSEFRRARVEVVVPDVFCFAQGDGTYAVTLNEGEIPNLVLDKSYREMIHSQSKLEHETRKYLHQKLDNAKWLIDAIEQRRQTILRISQAIVDYQTPFLNEGKSALRPLKMEQIAESAHVDISTVSRVVNGKWMQTPRGVFELRDFFTAGISVPTSVPTSDSASDSASGLKNVPTGEVSRDAIQLKIQEIVDSEDKSAPLSDDKIMTDLQKLGFNISRRTVVKYREELGIPSSRGRKVWT